ncbi:MAG: AzlC family ABC transporter permease [Clostridia bacterium]|nr:AzlC family ABC transporter permease [Clostridia bacterium]
MKMNYTYGLKRGLPIALGYLSVAFGFGITAVSAGLAPWQAVIVSLTNFTSAGQVAGVSVIATLGTVIEMIIAQFIINLRYALMGIALTQKLSGKFTFLHRFIAAFGISDESFVMAVSEKEKVTPAYMYGLMTLPIMAWTLGTAIGAYSGSVLPISVRDALGLAIYAMFVAIIVPPARDNRAVMWAVIMAAALSSLIYYVPWLSAHISSGFSVIICAVVASAALAKLCPVNEVEKEEQSND